MKRYLAAVVLFGTALLGAGCGGSGKRLNAGGSTFVYPMMSKWADEYRQAGEVDQACRAVNLGQRVEQDVGARRRPQDVQPLAGRIKLGDVGRTRDKSVAHDERAKGNFHGPGKRKPVSGQRLRAADRRSGAPFAVGKSETS